MGDYRTRMEAEAQEPGFDSDEALALVSIAISLKRIADALHRDPGAGLPTFLDQLHGVLSDASHDHAQRMS
jgi:hypothetical protein